MCGSKEQDQEQRDSGAGVDIMEEFFLTAVEDCSRLSVGEGGAPHHWEDASGHLVGSKTKAGLWGDASGTDR